MGVQARCSVIAAVVGLVACWFAGQAGAITPTVTEYPTLTTGGAGSGPDGITSGPDGNVWFAEYNAGQIGRIPPNAAPDSSAQVSEFPVPAGATSNPTQIVKGADGAMWFTERGGNAIGRITSDGATVNEFTVQTGGSLPVGITSGPDGAIWFTERADAASKIGRISVSNPSAGITEFPLTVNSGPFRITSGPDGNLWFTEFDAGKVGRIAPNGSQLQEISVPSGATSKPRGIVAGPDGNLWFVEQVGNAVGRIPTSATAPNPQVIEFPLPHANSQPTEIAVGPDGYLWFTEQVGSRIGRIPPTATSQNPQIEEFTVPLGDVATGITLGPDGNMWFTENATSKVGRITTPPTATTGAATAVTGSTATIAGAANGHAQSTSYHFEYGVSGGALTSTSETGTGQGGAADAQVSANLTALSPSTTYRYRIVVTNGTGASAGTFMTFTTAAAPPPGGGGSGAPAPPPSASTTAASGIAQTSAILNATVDPHGGPTAASFQYGTRADLVGATSTAPQVVPTGLGAVAVSTSIAGLTPSTRYYFRVVATDTATGAGVNGSTVSFTTAAPLRRVDATMSWDIPPRGHRFVVKHLLVVKAPGGARITVLCHGGGCPFASRSRAVPTSVSVRRCAHGRCRTVRRRVTLLNVELARLFSGHLLAPRTKLTVRIEKASWIGKVYLYTLKSGIQPEINCLQPGSTQPGAGCS
jgi:streptogramin lyase